MEKLKKVLKIVGIIAAIAAAAAGVYFMVKKLKEKKALKEDNELESFVSCSCLDDEPILVEDKPAE